MSKPEWKDAPAWAQWLAQNGSPRYTWVWFHGEPRMYIHGWLPIDNSDCLAMPGELNLRWHKTLEHRP